MRDADDFTGGVKQSFRIKPMVLENKSALLLNDSDNEFMGTRESTKRLANVLGVSLKEQELRDIRK